MPDADVVRMLLVAATVPQLAKVASKVVQSRVRPERTVTRSMPPGRQVCAFEFHGHTAAALPCVRSRVETRWRSCSLAAPPARRWAHRRRRTGPWCSASRDPRTSRSVVLLKSL